MMEIQQQLILTAGIVYFGLISVQPHDQTAYQATTSKVDEKSKIQKNFQSLFNSIAKNDAGKSEIQREILKQEVTREQQTFDSMKEELQLVRNRNAYRKRNFYKRNNFGENIIAVKRETNESNPKNGVTTIGSVITKTDGKRIPVTETTEFMVSDLPATGPPPEEAYYDCLVEAKWQIDNQKFHICSIKQSYRTLRKFGMKMPEFHRLLNIMEDFYNFTILLIDQKMRGEELPDERYDPTYKATFLKLSQTWQDLVAELDKQTPKYNTENQIRKMREEMYTASNSSYDTYFLLSDLQTNMVTTTRKPRNSSYTTGADISIRLSKP